MPGSSGLSSRPRCPACCSYSFGVLLWEIVTGERPVRGALRMPRPDECPADIADLILACGEPSPEARPTAVEVLHRLRAATQD